MVHRDSLCRTPFLNLQCAMDFLADLSSLSPDVVILGKRSKKPEIGQEMKTNYIFQLQGRGIMKIKGGSRFWGGFEALRILAPRFCI